MDAALGMAMGKKSTSSPARSPTSQPTSTNKNSGKKDVSDSTATEGVGSTKANTPAVVGSLVAVTLIVVSILVAARFRTTKVFSVDGLEYDDYDAGTVGDADSIDDLAYDDYGFNVPPTIDDDYSHIFKRGCFNGGNAPNDDAAGDDVIKALKSFKSATLHTGHADSSSRV